MNPPVLRLAAAADVEEAWRRFPYGLFYRLIQDQVVAVACFYAKRSPRVWRSRY